MESDNNRLKELVQQEETTQTQLQQARPMALCVRTAYVSTERFDANISLRRLLCRI